MGQNENLDNGLRIDFLCIPSLLCYANHALSKNISRENIGIFPMRGNGRSCTIGLDRNFTVFLCEYNNKNEVVHSEEKRFAVL